MANLEKEGLGREGEIRKVNLASAEEIDDFSNKAMRELFEEAELAEVGSPITADDYQSIKSRAHILLQQEVKPISAQTTLMTAFAERMKLVGKMSEEKLKSVSTDALRAVVYAETGELFDVEEIELFKKSPLGLVDWAKGRTDARRTIH